MYEYSLIYVIGDDTLKASSRHVPGMDVTVEVVGEDTYEVSLAEPTYADLCDAVGYSTHEVSVLVDGRPVPEDQPVSVERVQVLRLVQGG